MNIEQLDSSRVLISFGDNELASYNLSYTSLDLHSAEGRHFISKLLITAEEKTGIPLIGKKLLIESIRYKSGCMLLITARQQHKRRIYRIRRRSGTYTFRFDSADDLLSCLEKTRLPPYTLTGEDGIYRLIIRHAMPGRPYMHILSEYSSGFVRSDIYALSVMEHTHLLKPS